MTGEDMRIRDEILTSANGEVTEIRHDIDQRLEFAQQLAIWETVEPQFIRATE